MSASNRPGASPDEVSVAVEAGAPRPGEGVEVAVESAKAAATQELSPSERFNQLAEQVQGIANQMIFESDAKFRVAGGSLRPQYDFNSSIMASKFEDLMTAAGATAPTAKMNEQMTDMSREVRDAARKSPADVFPAKAAEQVSTVEANIESRLTNAYLTDDIKQQIAQLNTNLVEQQSNILRGQLFTETSWNKCFTELQENLTRKTDEARNADEKKFFENMVNNTEAVKKSAMDELKRLNDKLAIQRDNNYSSEMYQRITSRGDIHYGWKNITADPVQQDPNDPRSASGFELAGSTDFLKKLGNYGIYEAPPSDYLIKFTKGEDGRPHISAQFRGEQPESFGRQLGVGILKTAAGFMVAPTLPIQVGIMMATYAYSLVSGNPDAVYKPFFGAIRDWMKPKEYDLAEALKIETRFAIEVARSRDLVIDYSRGKAFDQPHIENIINAVQQMKELSGYQSKPTPGHITKFDTAMNLIVTQETKNLLGMATPTQQMLSRNSRKMLEDIYRKNNNGSIVGFEKSNYRELILNEIKRYEDAYKAAYAQAEKQGLLKNDEPEKKMFSSKDHKEVRVEVTNEDRERNDFADEKQPSASINSQMEREIQQENKEDAGIELASIGLEEKSDVEQEEEQDAALGGMRLNEEAEAPEIQSEEEQKEEKEDSLTSLLRERKGDSSEMDEKERERKYDNEAPDEKEEKTPRRSM